MRCDAVWLVGWSLWNNVKQAATMLDLFAIKKKKRKGASLARDSIDRARHLLEQVVK
jgi:hypothetical protein